MSSSSANLQSKRLPSGHSSDEEAVRNGLFRHVLESLDGKSRMSSSSSDCSSDSQAANVNGGDTPLVGSDSEETPSGEAVERRVSPEDGEQRVRSSRSCCEETSRTK